eukprot:TCONS_00021241-protein
MKIQIDLPRKEACERLGYDFLDESKRMDQVGYIANMVNQIRAVLFDIRLEALKYQNDNALTDGDLRKCPHCDLSWFKAEGCDEETTCGDIPSLALDIPPDIAVMAGFSFKVLGSRQIWIEKTYERVHDFRLIGYWHLNPAAQYGATEKESMKEPSDPLFGIVNGERIKQPCGREIVWRDMPVVAIPTEIKFDKDNAKACINTADIPHLPDEGRCVK